MPQAVRAAVEKFFGPAGGYEEPMKRSFDGAACYIVTGSHNGKPVELILSKTGDLQEVATQMAFDDLPSAVRSKLRDNYRNAQFDVVRSLELNLYEVGTVSDKTGNRQIVHIFAAGNRWPETLTEAQMETTSPKSWAPEGMDD